MVFAIHGAAVVALICNLLLFAMEVFAIRIQIRDLGWAGLRFYTILSNDLALLASGVYLVSAFFPTVALSSAAVLLRYIATCMLTLTFLIVLFVLAPLDKKAGRDPKWNFVGGSTPVHHVFAPIVSFVSFVFFEPNASLRISYVWVVMGITLVYSLIILILNIKRVLVGPYAFFHVYEQPIWASAIWFLAIGALSYLLDFGICRAGML
ncbi:MAG: hypothetical protein IJ679_11305 [Lachnospiraceae bacterium]|nr:hypothetical protein [Lachnospiraceae bacterium]